jgi:proteasome-associated ATPase
MPRPPQSDLPDDATNLIAGLSSLDSRVPTPEHQLALVQSLRARSPDAAAAVDRSLLGQLGALRTGLLEARTHLGELRQVLERLSATPWHAAVFLGPLTTGGVRAAAVACNGGARVVSVAAEIDLDKLAVGDPVLLGSEMNVIMQTLGAPLPRTADIAEFRQVVADGRVLLRHRDEEVLVHAAPSLDTSALSAGECVRWDRSVGLAFERIERTHQSPLFLEDTPAEGFDRIGGLDAQIAQITRSLRLQMLHPEIASRYGVRRVASILLVGPPGTGKTMLARALANWLGQHAPAGRARFMSIKPAELHSMWYGQSEANYREAFRVARQTGDADPSTPVVMFWDEVDAVGSTRGNSLGHIDDRVLTSFMTELDGLEARGNILVVAATNRRDTLDPALARPGRLGDLVIDIPRLGMAAAAAVFDKHLSAGIPYQTEDAGDARGARRRLIDIAVSRLYAPNGEGDLAAIMFRDGTRRAVRACDLMSGARIANIARSAIERACLRDLEQGEAGVTASDLHDAIARELASAVAALTVANCHAFISDLPQDLPVARVEPVARQVRRPYRFRSVA